MKTFLLLTLTSLSLQAFAQQKWNYPPTPKTPVYDTIFGRVVKDDYRWMEEANSPAFISWIEAQNKFTDSVLRLIPGQDELMSEFRQSMQSANDVYSFIQKSNNYWLYLKTIAATRKTAVYKRDLRSGEETLVLDPLEFIPGRKLVISGLEVFSKGDLALIRMYASGNEITTARVVDLANGKFFSDTVSGFEPKALEINGAPYIMYAKFNSTDVKASDFYDDKALTIHQVGKEGVDKTIFRRSLQKELAGNKNDAYRFYTSAHSPFAMILYYNGNLADDVVYWAKKTDLTQPDLAWKRFKAGDMEMEDGGIIILNGNYVYYRTYDDNPFGSVKRRSFTDGSINEAATIFSPPHDWIIKSTAAAKDHIIITTTKNGVESKVYTYSFRSGKVEAVPATINGTATAYTAGPVGNDGIILKSTWTEPPHQICIDLVQKKVQPTFFTPVQSSNPNKNLVVEEVEVKSHDGVLIPLSVIYDKTLLKKDGTNITHIGGYGSFGTSMNPSYAPFFDPLLKRGLVIAVAHVRGGGEKGEDWHKAALFEHKQNTWKDFNACAEWLIKNKYTSPAKLSTAGGSAGGLLIGMATTTRPDLYSVASPSVGYLNAYRGHASPNGKAMNTEIGNIANPDEAQWVLDADAYLNVRQGQNYPAQLITAGYNDPRVVVWQPAKYAAAMQASSSGDGPILLKVNMQGGHFRSADPDEALKNLTSSSAFRLWQCGHPDFQPKK